MVGEPIIRRVRGRAGVGASIGNPRFTLETTRSKGEQAFMLQARTTNLPPYEREFRFWPGRKFRFDFAWPERLIAAEVEGGSWNGGRHTRGTGFASDCEKYNMAALMRWRVFRFTTEMVKNGTAIATMQEALA